jgi:hypothetical protein
MMRNGLPGKIKSRVGKAHLCDADGGHNQGAWEREYENAEQDVDS